MVKLLEGARNRRLKKSVGDVFIVYLVDNTLMLPTVENFASPDVDDWKDVQSEMDSILSNGAWELTDLPYGCKPVGCKWVFKKKFRPNGTIGKYKGQFVAKGYTKKEGKDFFYTYSPVARLTSIQALLALVA